MTKDTKTQPSGHEEAPLRFLDQYLPYWLSQASYWISSEFHREVARTGLTFAEWRVLACLYGSSGETISTLCRLALIKQSTLSKLVKRLEVGNLTLRQSTEGDRRQTLVSLTTEGQVRIAGLVSKAQAHQREILRPFGEENSRALINTLQELVREHERSGLFDHDSVRPRR
ncbi:MAG: MarR family winged helix-turn-helix transcriptional regulator [Azonexus sp.]|jgi:DNA-binding MarR family transcriptional regulator|nr:MarR family winged helix-turn-helix transcriptional regulator [Azonexus sp.]